MRKPKTALLIDLFVAIVTGAFSAFLAIREFMALIETETKRPFLTLTLCAFTAGFCLYAVFSRLREYLKG